MDRSGVRRYFAENARAWIADAHAGDGHVYPTALARLRKTVAILSGQFPKGAVDVVDLGCGGGQLCLCLAECGYRTTGIDESEAMIAEALQTLACMPEDVRRRVQFLHHSVFDNAFDACSFDAVTALGVIGYLPDDDMLFQEAVRLLKRRGLFVVSCRNRLLNIVSLSDYTVREIQNGSALELIEEIRELFQEVPEQDALHFVASLARVSSTLISETALRLENPRPETTPKFTMSIEARQHTPKRLLATARCHGLELEAFYGVHPHLLMASLNRLLPPGMFNCLSTSLDVLDHLPVSLIWSSVFIGVFRKP